MPMHRRFWNLVANGWTALSVREPKLSLCLKVFEAVSALWYIKAGKVRKTRYNSDCVSSSRHRAAHWFLHKSLWSRVWTENSRGSV